MAHFLVVYIHQPELPAKSAAEKVVRRLEEADWDGKLTIRVREGNPWVQVEGCWPNEVTELGRALSANGGQAVGLEEETTSSSVIYSRFRNGKFMFQFSKVENRETRGKPLDWEQSLLFKVDDEEGAVHSLQPIARQLNLPGFDGEQTHYWAVETVYKK